MKPIRRRHLIWILPLVTYAVFLWHSPYALMHLSLNILDWTLPTAGLVIWALARLARRQTWPATRLDRPILAWLIVTALTALFSVNFRGSLKGVWETLIGILILYLLVDATRRGWGSVLWRSFYLLTGVVFLIGAMEMANWYFGLPLVPTIDAGWLPMHGFANPFPPIVHRLNFALVNATALSGFVALVIPPILCTLPVKRNREMRIGLIMWLAAAGFTLFFALSRGGFLSLGVSMMVIVLGGIWSPQFRRWWRRLPKGIGRLILAVVIVGILAASVGVGYLLMSRLTAHRSGDMVRLDFWRSALEMFRDHPVTGVGPTAYGTALRRYRTPLLARDQINEAHNLFLEVAAEMGILGLAIGAWVLLALIWVWWRRWRVETAGSPTWWRVLGIGAALAGLVTRLLFDTFVDSAIIFATLLFVSYLLVSPLKKRSPQPNRWVWITTLALLTLFALIFTWDTWGYVSFNRGIVATRQGDTAKALSAVERARKIDPWMPLYACHAGYVHGLRAAEGDQDALQSALDEYEACIGQSPAGWVDQLNRASLLWQAEQRTEARVAIEKTTAETPLEWLPWLNRGYWAQTAGDREDAAWSYGWALSIEPQLASSPFWQQERRPAMWADILAAGEEALAQQGKSGEAQTRWRWEVSVIYGDRDAAIQEMEEWIAHHPHDAEVMMWIGKALLDQNNAQEAFSWLERAVSADPGLADSYILRGEAALVLGYREEAETNFRTALFLEPSTRAHLGLAEYYRAVGETDAALSEYDRALQRPIVIHTYELVLYRRSGWTMPLPQVTRIAPQHNAEAALGWGAILEQEGDLEAARQVYEAALVLDPFSTPVQRQLER